MRERRELSWQVGPSKALEGPVERWAPATVPGAVQLDWAAAEGWGDPAWDNEPQKFEWMEDRFWTYRTEVAVPADAEGRPSFLVCAGLDYAGTIRVDGRVVAEQEGMFTPIELPLVEWAGRTVTVEIVVLPAPKSRPKPEAPGLYKKQADCAVKPAVSYGWDFHPRLVPLGLWRETYLETRPAVHFREAELTYHLSEDLSRVAMCLDVGLSGSAAVRWRLRDPEGKPAVEAEATVDHRGQLTALLEQPRLWWPHDHGDQPLYTWEAELVDEAGEVLDTRSGRAGFRRVRLVMNEGTWQEPAQDEWPKTRSTPPIQLEINGRRIFARGSNWVSPDIFPGRLNRADYYQPLLDLAKAAHVNLLRCWGGAVVQKPSFFETCDELGILIWQEFPLACNEYPDDPRYIAVLDRESRRIIRDLRAHPCLAIWCGGNELFNSWSGMTDQHHAIRLLNANCYALDPDTPFLPTSPVMGVGHGCYRFELDDGRDVFQYFRDARHTAYTEFGCPGPADLEVLELIVPTEDRDSIVDGSAWQTRHAIHAWSGREAWLHPQLIERIMGPCATIAELVEAGRLLQREGYVALFEEARRQKPRCSMALNWCYNEPWPTAANNSVIGWPARPKAGYEALQRALRPTQASARIERFQWTAGETFAAELWRLHDGPAPATGGVMRAVLEVGDRTIELGEWRFDGAEPDTHQAGPVVTAALPDVTTQTMTLRLEVADQPAWSSAYTLRYRGRESPA